jgi:hypothetical protein
MPAAAAHMAYLEFLGKVVAAEPAAAEPPAVVRSRLRRVRSVRSSDAL